MVVVANYGFRDMLANWMCHADRLGLRYLVGLVDSEVEVWMKRHYPDVHTHLLLNDTDGKRMKEDTSYMSWEMLRIVWSCHLLVLHLLARGLSVLYMDVDVVLLADPVAAVRHSWSLSLTLSLLADRPTCLDVYLHCLLPLDAILRQPFFISLICHNLFSGWSILFVIIGQHAVTSCTSKITAGQFPAVTPCPTQVNLHPAPSRPMYTFAY